MKNYFLNIKKKLTPKKAERIMVLGVLFSAMLFFPSNVFASSGAETVTNGFNNLMDIVKALISSIGAIVLLWGFFEWGTSMQSQDGVMQSTAFKRIGGGLIMVLAPQLISAFVS